MEKYEVLVVGRGKLALELLHGLQGSSISGVLPWDERARPEKGRRMVVHAGSGRELDEVVDFCAAGGEILFELSTAGSRLPSQPAFPIVVCPNVNMQMLSFMAMTKQSAARFKGRDIEIT